MLIHYCDVVLKVYGVVVTQHTTQWFRQKQRQTLH